VPPLQMLADSDLQVVAVVTQPDRRAGRGRRLQHSAVKVLASELGVDVWQPASLRDPDAQQILRDMEPDLIVVAAFGQILRPEVLAIPPQGCINVHGSLLPKYRGAAPIPAAILADEVETGITVMLIDAGMDTGPMLSRQSVPIAADDTAGSLSRKLAQTGASLLGRTIPLWLMGEIEPQIQNDEQATLASPIRKSDGLLDWNQSARRIALQVRAYDPWPGTRSTWGSTSLKLTCVREVSSPCDRGKPGEVFARGDGAAVITGEGLLEILRLQLGGRSEMAIVDFLRGKPHLVGSVLGG